VSGEFPNVTVEVELTESPDHDGVTKQFYVDYLPRTIAAELDLEPVSS